MLMPPAPPILKTYATPMTSYVSAFSNAHVKQGVTEYIQYYMIDNVERMCGGRKIKLQNSVKVDSDDHLTLPN